MMSHEMTIAAVVAVAYGIMKGVFWGVEFLRKKWANETTKNAEKLKVEIQHVPMQDCLARHETLTGELRRGSDKMEKMDSSIQEVKTELINLSSQIGAGVELRIRKYADESAKQSRNEHEDAFHRGGGGTGSRGPFGNGVD